MVKKLVWALVVLPSFSALSMYEDLDPEIYPPEQQQSFLKKLVVNLRDSLPDPKELLDELKKPVVSLRDSLSDTLVFSLRDSLPDLKELLVSLKKPEFSLRDILPEPKKLLGFTPEGMTFSLSALTYMSTIGSVAHIPLLVGTAALYFEFMLEKKSAPTYNRPDKPIKLLGHPSGQDLPTQVPQPRNLLNPGQFYIPASPPSVQSVQSPQIPTSQSVPPAQLVQSQIPVSQPVEQPVAQPVKTFLTTTNTSSQVLPTVNPPTSGPSEPTIVTSPPRVVPPTVGPSEGYGLKHGLLLGAAIATVAFGIKRLGDWLNTPDKKEDVKKQPEAKGENNTAQTEELTPHSEPEVTGGEPQEKAPLELAQPIEIRKSSKTYGLKHALAAAGIIGTGGFVINQLSKRPDPLVN